MLTERSVLINKLLLDVKVKLKSKIKMKPKTRSISKEKFEKVSTRLK